MNMSVRARGCPRTQVEFRGQLWGQFSLGHVSLSDVNSDGYVWYLFPLSRLNQTCMILFISKCGQATRGSFGLDSRAKLQKQCELPWHWLETHLHAYFIYTNLNNNQFKATFLRQAWWLTPIVLALARLRHKDYCEFEDNLGYTMSSRPTWAMEWDLVSK